MQKFLHIIDFFSFIFSTNNDLFVYKHFKAIYPVLLI